MNSQGPSPDPAADARFEHGRGSVPSSRSDVGRDAALDRLRAQQSRRRAAAFAEVAEGLIIHDPHGIVLDVNPRVGELLGWSRQELIGSELDALLAPAHRAVFARARARCGTDSDCAEEFESEFCTRSGEPVPVAVRVAAVDAGEERPAALVASLRDLRPLRELAEERRVALKAARSAEDDERHRLAGELHDSLAQLLALTRIHIAALRDTEAASSVESRLAKMDELLAEADRRTRTLMFRVAPGDLQASGLVEPLREMCMDLSDVYALEVDFRDDTGGVVHGEIDDAVGVALFRAVRELVINVARHGDTDRATVRVASGVRPGTVRVTVVDGGRGFDMRRLPGHGFGLARLRDQFGAFGGTLEIDSAPGQGTQIVATMPLRPQREPQQSSQQP